MHKHDPKPTKHSSLEEQREDDPLDSTTMPRAARFGAPDKAKHVPRVHGGSHQPIQHDRNTAQAGHGRTHLPAKEEKGGSRAWVGPEKVGTREAIDELEPLETEEE